MTDLSDPPVAGDPIIVEDTFTPLKDVPPKKRPGRPKGQKVKTDGLKADGTPYAYKGRTSRAKTDAAVTAKIEDTLTKLLTSPAIAFNLMGDEFCTANIEQTASVLAKHLALLSEKYPAIRRLLLMANEAEGGALIIVSIIAFVYPSLAHHGILPTIPALGMIGINIPTPHTVAMAKSNLTCQREQFEQEIMEAEQEEESDEGL